MKKGQTVPQQLKELIIQKVKDGVPIAQLATEYDLLGYRSYSVAN